MKRLALRTVLPALLAIILFSGVVFVYLLPAVDRVVMDQKRLMIRELTESAWNILARFEAEERSGAMTRDQAQAQAVAQVRSLHYGAQGKDYFWIIDGRPYMVVHPYRPDLEGTDLGDFQDPSGRRLFVEMTQVVERDGAGYVRYMWQWKDESDRIVPKLSFVKGFAPWGWIIGTGVYTEDVDAEISGMKGNLQGLSLLILAAVALLLFLLLRVSFQSERGRLRAAAALRLSEEKYRSLVESAGESIIMSMSGQELYANTSLLHLLGYSREEFADQDVARIVLPTPEEVESGRRHWQALVDGSGPPIRYEAQMVHKEGSLLRVMLTLSRIVVQGRVGFMAVAARLSRPRELDVATATCLEDLEAACRRTRDLAALMMKHRADGVQVSTLLSAAADEVVLKAVDLITAEIGPAPCAFDFMLMGSLGRSEVTLLADQDHAIIFADPPADERPAVQAYFLKLGSRISELLDNAGFPLCEGGIMSGNPSCCQSYSEWCRTFEGWINTLEPDDLLQAKIFFDFRGILDQGKLVEELRAHLDRALEAQPRFFPLLAHSILKYEPPLSSFGTFITEETDDGQQVLDIKGVQAQISDLARLRALQHGVREVNTRTRLQKLFDLGHMRWNTVAETQSSYATLLKLRLDHQAGCRARQQAVDNMMDPQTLGTEQQEELKKAFQQIKALQTNLQHEFGTPS